jgi:type III secretion protein D
VNAPTLLTREDCLPATAAQLRIFGGRLDGVDYPLQDGGSVRLGHALDNDIVVRGHGTRGCRIALHAGAERMSVELLTGEARLLGQPLEIGRRVPLPHFVPLGIGEYSLAIGRPGDPRWLEAESLSRQLAETGAPAVPVPLPVAATDMRRRALSVTNHLPRWTRRPAVLFAGALALLALLGMGAMRDWATRDLRGVEPARRALAAGNFAGITVADADGDGRLEFAGTVQNEDRLAELRTLVADDFAGSQVDVDTSAALARAATDILAAEGIDAEASPAALGVLEIQSEYLPADRQRELQDRLKADLPALSQARFVLTGQRGGQDLAYYFSSATYGLATFVDGDPGHLVTADGSLWFEGAMLPTGHEVVSVRNGRVTLKRNGLIEEILVNPSTSAAGPAMGNSQGEN